ncbi:MAG: VIT1/CCC1 transporter family protein [Oscillospiraceae bacterium]
MDKIKISDKTKQLIVNMQINELTEYYIYNAIAKRVKDKHNREVLEKIGAEELAHSNIWKKYSERDAKPKRGKIFFMKLVSLVMGFTFAIKLMENGEELASGEYKKLIEEVPEAEKIMADEQRHENELIELLDEERLQYVGSMVLGLNDALVELTGTLAGLTFAMQNTRLVALSGLITGISATLSMASSEYLAAKNKGDANAFKSCVYTGIAYVITVALLVLPYLIFPSDEYVAALAVMIVIVILIIAFFNYYISVAKSQPFKRRFFEMAAISLSVALISFIIGLFVKKFLGIEI